MEIIYSSKFAREYKKLPQSIKSIAEEQEKIFRQDPFAPKLKTHKLKGRLRGFLSFSIGYKYRIIFEFSRNKKTVYNVAARIPRLTFLTKSWAGMKGSMSNNRRRSRLISLRTHPDTPHFFKKSGGLGSFSFRGRS